MAANKWRFYGLLVYFYYYAAFQIIKKILNRREIASPRKVFKHEIEFVLKSLEILKLANFCLILVAKQRKF